jgi:hypothetical protein
LPQQVALVRLGTSIASSLHPLGDTSDVIEIVADLVYCLGHTTC